MGVGWGLDEFLEGVAHSETQPERDRFQMGWGSRAGPDFILPVPFSLVYFLVNIPLGARKTLCGLWWQEGPASGFGQFPLPLRASVSTSKMGLLEEVIAVHGG